MIFCYLALFCASEISRYVCGANIDGHLYNLSAGESTEYYTKMNPDKSWEYRIKLCGSLPKEAFPAGVEYIYGVSALRCKPGTTNCDIVGYRATQDYDKIGSNPDEGFVIYQVAFDGTKYDDIDMFKFTFVMSCDSSKTEIKPGELLEFPVVDRIKIISVEYSNNYSCPAPTAAPTPTPEVPFDCSFTSYSDVVYPYGISLNFKDKINDHSGYPFTINNTHYSLVKACGLIACPPKTNCDADMASVWVCERDENCYSYGNAKDYIGVKIRTDNTPDEGLLVSYDKTDAYHTGKMSVTCDFDISQNILRIDNFGFDVNGFASIAASSYDVCMSPQKTPDPKELACSQYFDYDGDKKYVSLDVLNTKGGYKFAAKVTPSQPEEKHFVSIQPCGGINCPGAECEPPNGANVWLCESENNDPYKCVPYGVYGYNVSISPTTQHHLEDGFTVKYISGNNKTNLDSVLKIECDWLLPIWKMDFDPNVEKLKDSSGSYKTLSVKAFNRDVCVGNPPYMPPTPKPTVTPPPDHDIPQEFVRIVDEKQISINYESMLNTTPHSFDLNINSVIGSNSFKGLLYYTPFEPQTCPANYSCDVLSESDAWICYYRHCFPVALHSMYNVEDISGSTTEESSYRIRGAYDYQMEFTIKCNPSSSILHISSDAVFDNTTTGGKQVFRIKGEGSFACFQDIPNPEIIRKPATGGAVFLLIIGTISILYIFIGTTYKFIRTKQIDIPNQAFWTEFLICMQVGLQYITCERYTPADLEYSTL